MVIGFSFCCKGSHLAATVVSGIQGVFIEITVNGSITHVDASMKKSVIAIVVVIGVILSYCVPWLRERKPSFDFTTTIDIDQHPIRVFDVISQLSKTLPSAHPHWPNRIKVTNRHVLSSFVDSIVYYTTWRIDPYAGNNTWSIVSHQNRTALNYHIRSEFSCNFIGLHITSHMEIEKLAKLKSRLTENVSVSVSRWYGVLYGDRKSEMIQAHEKALEGLNIAVLNSSYSPDTTIEEEISEEDVQ